MGDLPERFRLVVTLSATGDVDTIEQFNGHRQAANAVAAAQKMAAEKVGRVVCVMSIEAAYRASAPVAKEEHLPWPEAPLPPPGAPPAPPTSPEHEHG